ncbi:peptidase, M42 (glutamyl aminopeptidase) family [Streptococcus pneumoniae]|nr:peptidase, M42 (glutamyl aminopeptidase) family [Streptococcus pneumoniae]
MNQTVEYIKELTAIASPTGFTREISNYLVKTLKVLVTSQFAQPRVVSM